MALTQIFQRTGRFTYTGQGIIALYSFISATANYDTFKVAGAAYQVTAGKTLYLIRFDLYTEQVNSAVLIGYGDTSVANGVGPPTNAKTMIDGLAGPVAETPYVTDGVEIPIPAAKFPYVKGYLGASCHVTAYGYEI